MANRLSHPAAFQRNPRNPQIDAEYAYLQAPPMFFQPDGSVGTTLPTFPDGIPEGELNQPEFVRHLPLSAPPAFAISQQGTFSPEFSFQAPQMGGDETKETGLKSLQEQLEEMRLGRAAAEAAAKHAREQREELWARLKKVEGEALRLVDLNVITAGVKEQIFSGLRPLSGKKRTKKLGVFADAVTDTFTGSESRVLYADASTSTSESSSVFSSGSICTQKYVSSGSDPVSSTTDAFTQTSVTSSVSTGSDPIVSSSSSSSSSTQTSTSYVSTGTAPISTSVNSFTQTTTSYVDTGTDATSKYADAFTQTSVTSYLSTGTDPISPPSPPPTIWQSAKRKVHSFLTPRRVFKCFLVVVLFLFIVSLITRSRPKPTPTPEPTPKPKINQLVLREMQRAFFPVCKDDVSVVEEPIFCDANPLCWLNYLRVYPARPGTHFLRLKFACQYMKEL